MEKKQPLITIITPSYMQGRYIEDCILSIKNQSWKHLEHIILDSCSTDSTDEVVNRHLKDYPAVYIREKDSGQANAINKGLDMAKGDIVCWLNADDFFMDERVLEKIVRIFNSFAQIDAVTGDGYYTDENRKLTVPITLEKPKYVQLKFLRHADYILQPSTFWKRNKVRMDETLHYAFDWKFFMDLHKEGLAFIYSPEYYSCYRVQRDSKTFQDNAARKKEVCQVLRYNGVNPLSLLWADIVYLNYWISEKTGIPVFRATISFLNKIFKRLTDGIIYSC